MQMIYLTVLRSCASAICGAPLCLSFITDNATIIHHEHEQCLGKWPPYHVLHIKYLNVEIGKSPVISGSNMLEFYKGADIPSINFL